MNVNQLHLTLTNITRRKCTIKIILHNKYLSFFLLHIRTQSYLYDVTLSLCGWEPEPSEERFIKHSVEFSELCNNPSLLESNKLVVKFMDKYYNYKVAGPMIFSLMIYQRPLPQVRYILNLTRIILNDFFCLVNYRSIV